MSGKPGIFRAQKREKHGFSDSLGGVNGIYNVLQEITEPVRQNLFHVLKVDTNSFLWKCFCGFITFFFIDISWLFFRASGMHQSIAIIKKIRNDFNLWYFFSDGFFDLFGTTKNFAIVACTLIVLLLIDISRKKEIDVKGYLLKQQIIYRWLVYLTIIFIIMLWGAYGSDYGQTQFIYFQF